MSSDFDLLVEDHFRKKDFLGFDQLAGLVEEIMQASTLLETKKSKSKGRRVYDMVLGQFKAPTEQAGKMDTAERQNFQKYIATNITGTTLEEKITQINMVASGAVDESAPISEILASLGALKMLQQTLDDFNESTAGFIFEAFLSALLEGKQVTDKVGGTLPIEDCMFFVDPKTGEMGQPVSLKLLAHTTVIEGSLVNLLGFFMRPEIAAVANEKGIEYIVATKTKGSRLDLYSFTITPDNFFNWIDEKYFDFSKLDKEMVKRCSEEAATRLLQKDEAEALVTEDLNSEEIITKNARLWISNVKRYRYPMMGLDPEQDIKMDWRKVTDWRSAVPLPSSSAKKRDRVAQILLSDQGKRMFEAFKQKKFNVANIDELEIPVELEAQFLQDENPEARSAAALELAKLARLRREAYLDTTINWGLDQPESPIHIQRYFAMLNPKTGQMKAIDAQQLLKDVLAPDGKPGGAQAVMAWACMLSAIRVDTQFSIRPITVRGRGTVYGTVNISESAIIRSLTLYSERLEELVLPIYETLGELTDHINGYYFENRPGDAFKAADDAVELQKYTQDLTAKTKEN